MKDKWYYYIATGMLLLGTVASVFQKANKNKLRGKMPWLTSILVSILSGTIGGMLGSVYFDDNRIQWVIVAIFAWLGENGIDAIKDFYINKLKK